jgi:hypothetical protein
MAKPHPFGVYFSSLIIFILVHLPSVASKSTCWEIIYSFVKIYASGLICGGKLTPEAIALKDPANLFTISNFYSIDLKN